MAASIELHGNVYYQRDGVTYKKHGAGEKVVGNPETIAAVAAALQAQTTGAAEAPALPLAPGVHDVPVVPDAIPGTETPIDPVAPVSDVVE